MNSKSAYKIILNSFPDKKAVSCFEYDSAFVFKLIDKRSTDPNIFDWLIAVDKKTSEVHAFMPLEMSIDEYKRGKEVDFE